MSFPGQGPFPGGGKRSCRTRRKKKPLAAPPIPPEERTHAPSTRFKLACGASRIGLDESLVATREAPTCPACRRALREAEGRAEVVREALKKLPESREEW